MNIFIKGFHTSNKVGLDLMPILQSLEIWYKVRKTLVRAFSVLPTHHVQVNGKTLIEAALLITN